MSRVRTYLVGRERDCDVRIDDASVSRYHAEVVRLSHGFLHVTDRVSANGTFVLDGGVWRPIRQSIVDPAGQIRFGAYELSAERLDAMCPRNGAQRSVDTGPADAPDPSRPLVRDPETGEILEQ